MAIDSTISYNSLGATVTVTYTNDQHSYNDVGYKIWNNNQPWTLVEQESPFEKIMKDIVLKEEVKKLIKEAMNEILTEIEEKNLHDKLTQEFNIEIKRKRK